MKTMNYYVSVNNEWKKVNYAQYIKWNGRKIKSVFPMIQVSNGMKTI